MTRVGPPRTAVVLACLLVLAASAALAGTVSPWALLAAPVALAVGTAGWLGARPGAVLDALSGTGDDPGRGPAGLAP